MASPTRSRSEIRARMPRVAPLFDQLLVSGGNFLTIAICAHTLSPEEQGKVGVVLSTYLITSIINQTAILQMAAVRLAREDETEGLTHRLADFQLTMALLTTGGMVLALVGLAGTIGMEASWGEMTISGAFFFAQQLADFDRRISYAVAAPIRGLSSSAAVYPARILLLWALPFETMTTVYAIASATAAGPAVLTVRRMLRAPSGMSERLAFYRSHVRTSRWLLAGAPLAWAWAQLPVYFLGNALGMAAVGAFVSIRSITNVANVGLEVLETHFSPLLARVYHREGSKRYRTTVLRVLGAGTAFWGLGFGIVLVAGDWIVVTAVGAAYAPHTDILRWLWAGSLPYFLFRVDGIDLRNKGGTAAVPMGFLAGTACSAVGCLLFLPQLGVVGAAMARTLAATGLLAGQRAARPVVLRHPGLE